MARFTRICGEAQLNFFGYEREGGDGIGLYGTARETRKTLKTITVRRPHTRFRVLTAMHNSCTKISVLCFVSKNVMHLCPNNVFKYFRSTVSGSKTFSNCFVSSFWVQEMF